MRNLKLYLAEFDPNKGLVAYSIEDEKGDRVDKGRFTHENLKNYDPKTMDFFLLGYLPKVMEVGDNIEVLGPLSDNLVRVLESMQHALIRAGINAFAATTVKITALEQENKREYKEEDILVFAKTYLENRSLDETLASVFKYYK